MKQIIITRGDMQIRAALLEEGRLVEIIDDTRMESRLSGSIFQGRVTNIVPGIQAAFVDIGTGKNAFLYAGDAVKQQYDLQGEKMRPAAVPSIEFLLKVGQDIVVQVMREPVGNKGARVTTNLAVPGRFVVLLPGNKNYIGLSRKLTNKQEKERLQGIAEEILPEDDGIIIRTLAEGVPAEEFAGDLEKMLLLKRDIERKIAGNVQGLLYSGNDPVSRLVREIIDDEVDSIIIDNGDLAASLRGELQKINCPAATKIWTDLKGDLFERFYIRDEIKKALQSKVPLKCGGYLVLEQTEALTAIDVNSGRYTGGKSLQDTMLQLNLAAAAEISRQIRLRNLSGIIVVDFIDMENRKDWEELLERLEKLFLRDRVKSRLVGLTKLGLVEITRKKEGQTLDARYMMDCPQCGGKGRVVNIIS